MRALHKCGPRRSWLTSGRPRRTFITSSISGISVTFSRGCSWHSQSNSRQPKSSYIYGCTRAKESTGTDWCASVVISQDESVALIDSLTVTLQISFLSHKQKCGTRSIVPSNALDIEFGVQVSTEDLTKYNTLAQQQAKKLFSTLNMSKFYAAENADPLVFCHFADNIQDQIYDQVRGESLT